MDVTVITQTHDSETDQGTHVQGQDGDEQRLGALQVTVEENGHEHDLQGRTRPIKRTLDKIGRAPLRLRSLPEPPRRRRTPSRL